mmetsp:Transcript_2323/g.15454  ORF Transcript_2323/g.15454 Transcript_2323/m.15454 type:complete len:265 (-) Transcript_2323:399-1193(-)
MTRGSRDLELLASLRCSKQRTSVQRRHSGSASPWPPSAPCLSASWQKRLVQTRLGSSIAQDLKVGARNCHLFHGLPQPSRKGNGVALSFLAKSCPRAVVPLVPSAKPSNKFDPAFIFGLDERVVVSALARFALQRIRFDAQQLQIHFQGGSWWDLLHLLVSIPIFWRYDQPSLSSHSHAHDSFVQCLDERSTRSVTRPFHSKAWPWSWTTCARAQHDRRAVVESADVFHPSNPILDVARFAWRPSCATRTRRIVPRRSRMAFHR